MLRSEEPVNDAPLVGATRVVAEARCRVAFALSLLSAGTPMFFMGEEILAQKSAKYDDIVQAKEDLYGQRGGIRASMFRFYQDLLELTVGILWFDPDRSTSSTRCRRHGWLLLCGARSPKICSLSLA
jgi:1,4-alpha-glucan branching enzyme